MKLGFVRIKRSLGQFRGKKALISSNGMVIAHIPVTTQNRFYYLLTVHGVLQSQPHIIVIIRFYGGQHGDRIMLCTIGLDYINALHFFQ